MLAFITIITSVNTEQGTKHSTQKNRLKNIEKIILKSNFK